MPTVVGVPTPRRFTLQITLEHQPEHIICEYCKIFLDECDDFDLLNNRSIRDDDEIKHDKDYLTHINYYRGVVTKLFREEFLPEKVRIPQNRMQLSKFIPSPLPYTPITYEELKAFALAPTKDTIKDWVVCVDDLGV
ncbi:9413_t:CDS:2 [Ambispora gerdemannii]|uniref:9413_t:CDS:1 n=1 Tax=Ambispora gerdemannii TaxID=144530 RepID=A0A9N8VNR9_9GLOM|nr:9413_t:CDS:2 [Ambispora gerdemannii]